MINFLIPIRGSLKACFKFKEITTEHIVFRFHCVLTTAALLTASILLTTSQLIGDPIECLVSGIDKEFYKAVTTFCWVTSTFTMPDAFHRTVGSEVPMKGIANDKIGEKKYYGYYQWVCYMLVIQGLMCYVPKGIWNMAEGELMSNLASGLNAICPTEEKQKKIDNIVRHMTKYRNCHKLYMFKYWICEFLCLLNVVVQMCLMNAFLGGEFFRLGSAVLEQTGLPQHERFDKLIYIFPRVTKCVFNYGGVGGGVQIADAICVIPQNIINEKTYVFLWFWFIMLAVMLSILLVFRALQYFIPRLRPRLLNARSRSLVENHVIALSNKLDVGDWWLLYNLGRNMDFLVYRDLITALGDKMNETNKSLYPKLYDEKTPFNIAA